MSRIQADQVALAVDEQSRPLYPPEYAKRIMAPLSNTTYKRWIASGAIVPPRYTGELSDRFIFWFFVFSIVAVSVGFLYGVTR